MLSVLSGHTDCVYSLLNKGASVEAKDKWGRTALHRGVRTCHFSYICCTWYCWCCGRVFYVDTLTLLPAPNLIHTDVVCIVQLLCDAIAWIFKVLVITVTIRLSIWVEQHHNESISTNSLSLPLEGTNLKTLISSYHSRCNQSLSSLIKNWFLLSGSDRTWGMCGGLASAQRQLPGARL